VGKDRRPNFNAYVARRIAEAGADTGVIPEREMYNPRAKMRTPFDETNFPRAKMRTPFDETNFPDQYQSDQMMYRQSPKIPPQLRRDPPIEKIEVDFW
jgi:hypothetical protein